MQYTNVLRLVATIMVIMIHTCSVGELNIPPGEEYAYGLLKHIGIFAVPIFAMISGCFFLDPNKKISIKTIIHKYCKRICMILLCFALPMCLAETLVNGQPLWTCPYNFVRGHSWTHMWYLYMLVCLYLLTPCIRTFIINSSKKEIEFTLFVLFTLSILIPSLKTYGIDFKYYIAIGTPFIFYYILGYYLSHVETLHLNVKHCCAMVLIYFIAVAILEVKGYAFTERIFEYHDIIHAFGAASIFLLFKRLGHNWNLANNLRIYCLPIYLVHTLFTNISYKFINIIPSDIASPWISVPLFTVIFFLASLTLAYILRHIKFLREHVI